MKKIVLVESPAKVKTINKYLGSEYKVIASYGHIRDLKARSGSVRPEENFAMVWQNYSKSEKHIENITSSVDKGTRLILATDPDREGEAISWHVLEILQKKGVLKDKPVERIVFNAINRNNVLKALDNPRNLDQNLIDAYLARRALDYLVGFTLAPILWRKLPGIRSAGRVQSVSLRIICDREKEIESFISQEYWQIQTKLKANQSQFIADLCRIDDSNLKKHDIKTADEAAKLQKQLEQSDFEISGINEKTVSRKPSAPFTTSTMQQEASNKLGLSPARTMRIAQQLYEGMNIKGQTQGLITYMRTDGVHIAPEAIKQCIKSIKDDFGQRYLPEKPRFYKTKTRNAQEAHEAIRPSDFSIKPEEVRQIVDKKTFELYQLIWNRTLASQMADAKFSRTRVDITAKLNQKELGLRLNASLLKFDGFLKLSQNFQDKNENNEAENQTIIAELKTKQKCQHIETKTSQHFTEPPPRYSEASIIKKLEELGIGRPSTYTTILSTLKDREYIALEKKQLRPQDKGRVVTIFLQQHFAKYIEYNFTAELEDKLDSISDGKLKWLKVMEDFWQDFYQQTDNIKDMKTADAIDELNAELADIIFPKDDNGKLNKICPKCTQAELSIKLSRYGIFIGCQSYPVCRYTRSVFAVGKSDDNIIENHDSETVLGLCKQSGAKIYQKTGRYGPFVERELQKSEKKPKRASIPKTWQNSEINLEKAEKLLSLPRSIGIEPEKKLEITAAIGRYGPYIKSGVVYRRLNNIDEVFEIGLNRAIDMLHEEKKTKTKSKNTKKSAGQKNQGKK